MRRSRPDGHVETAGLDLPEQLQSIHGGQELSSGREAALAGES